MIVWAVPTLIPKREIQQNQPVSKRLLLLYAASNNKQFWITHAVRNKYQPFWSLALQSFMIAAHSFKRVCLVANLVFVIASCCVIREKCNTHFSYSTHHYPRFWSFPEVDGSFTIYPKLI